MNYRLLHSCEFVKVVLPGQVGNICTLFGDSLRLIGRLDRLASVLMLKPRNSLIDNVGVCGHWTWGL